jgi:hypothetical protein
MDLDRSKGVPPSPRVILFDADTSGICPTYLQISVFIGELQIFKGVTVEVGGESSIDGEAGSGDEGRGGTAQPADRLGDFLRGTAPAQRGCITYIAFELLRESCG